jgi:Protein of unknown function (DUF1822)
MSTFHKQIQTVAEIYSEHVWIDIDLHNLGSHLSQSEINQICVKEVSKHLAESLKLVVKPIFPSGTREIAFIAELVNGFVLSIADLKVAFIPSQDLDLMGFEVQREWIELSNWVADYYVPIQVDLEHSCLHLWGFIPHQYLQQQASLDRTFRTYEVEGTDLISDLDSLWMACDPVANRQLASERGEIPSLPILSHVAAQVLIDRLQQHNSVFSPRLVLPFEQWGAIMNSPEYLNTYANPKSAIIEISEWFKSSINSGWQTIEDFCYQPALLPGFYGTPKLEDKFKIKGIPLTTAAEIRLAVHNLYHSQNSAKKVILPVDIDSPILLLIYLIHHTADQTLRWTAAEYLWTIQPDSDRNWHRRIRDLGVVMKGHKLGLMVAAIPLLDGSYAILNRVYSIGSPALLPANVKLELLSAAGEQLYQTDSSSMTKYNYIQLYFIAGVSDRFNIRVSIDDDSITEAFVI